MEKVWKELYKIAKSKINSKEIKPFIEYGTNSCAILTKKGNIYSGVSVNSTTNLSITAEKSAILDMLNHNENEIDTILVVNELEEVILPSVECINYLLEFNNIEKIKIIKNLDKGEYIYIEDILPDWWGTYRNKK